jgi:predicted nucleotidyltransferase
MKKNKYLPLIVKRLKKINPYRIILFGSQVKDANIDKDIDLLVVTKDKNIPQNYEELLNLYLKISSQLSDFQEKIAIDLLVYTLPMYEKFVKNKSMFARQILKEGIVLYETNH